jgi:hypothetical protein
MTRTRGADRLERSGPETQRRVQSREGAKEVAPEPTLFEHYTIDAFSVADTAPERQLQAFDGALSQVHEALAPSNESVGGSVSHRALADVQMASQDLMGGGSARIHAAAERGIKGSGGALPFADKIQASFGGHDISTIRAHTGGDAREANRAMGSMAYATGRDVAFRGTPDLFTTAHEAAHVIQQRAGVQLRDGVGQSGDRYEKHADEVATRVVEGRSAEDLLGQFGGRGGSPQVQRRAVQLDEGEAPATAADQVQRFNTCFEPVLHILGGTGTGGALTTEDLGRLFTPEQLEKLDAFAQTSEVPQRLFNGVTNTGELTAQRRILLSSHILLTGTFDPGSILRESGGSTESARAEGTERGAEPEGPASSGDSSSAGGESTRDEGRTGGGRREISANSCRHWAMLVYGYAGVPVPADGVDGLSTTHDATGAITLGGAAPATTRGGYGSVRGMMRGHGEREWAPYFSEGTRASSIFSPGDWLQLAWYRSGSGYNPAHGHSVVLARVARETDTHYFVDYYSQTDNREGVRELDRNQRLAKRMGGGSVVFSHRSMSAARNPETAAELFEGLHARGRDRSLASGRPNERTIRRHAPGVGAIDSGGAVLQWLCEHLAALNRARIDELGDRLTPEQRTLLDNVNTSSEASLETVEQLVRVNQRVVHTIENAAHVRHNAASHEGRDGHYWVGRSAGGNGLTGAWDPRSRTDDGAPLPMRDDAGGAALREISRRRSSGLLEDMPDASLIRWSECPTTAP